MLNSRKKLFFKKVFAPFQVELALEMPGISANLTMSDNDESPCIMAYE